MTQHQDSETPATAQAATPRPWMVLPSVDASVALIAGPEGEWIGQADARQGVPNHANAEIIVRAVNAFDGMRAALECVQALDLPYSEGKATLERHGYDHSGRFEMTAAQFVAGLVRAALEAANHG